jgi:transposase
MERYLGGDVHAASVSFTVRSESGKIVRRDVVETHGAALVSYLRQQPGHVHLCIEEGELSQWLSEILSPHVGELVVYRARWEPGNKSDRLDADGLSEKMFSRKFGQPVYKDPGPYGPLRQAARTYRMLTKDQARVKARIKSTFRSRGVACRGDAVYDAERRRVLARELPAPYRHAVEVLGQELEALRALQATAEREMLRESHRHAISRVLETAPGLGPIRVALLVPIVVTPSRFRTKRQFWSYCGFSIVTRSTSDWVRTQGHWRRAPVIQTRGLTREYNKTLKWLFKGAATTVLQHSGPNPLQDHYHALLEAGTRPNLAKLTIARQIAAIVLAMWKHQRRYEPERVYPTASPGS